MEHTFQELPNAEGKNNSANESPQTNNTDKDNETDLCTAMKDNYTLVGGENCLHDESTEIVDKPLSRNQLKRLKKMEKWKEMKPLKRAKERQKRKQRRREAVEKGLDMGPTRKKLKQNIMKNSECQIRVVIDCSFDHLMSQKDINQLGQQIQYCYSANRRAPDPVQLYITSLGDKTMARLDSIGDYKHWDVNIETKDYLSVFEKDKVVYLSSESENVLDTLEVDKAYIIGGLVDHNHQKGLCFKLAEEKGIAHAQLPIGQYLDMKTRKVLTINHVFEILLHFTETNNWEEAFFKVLPKRKGAAIKGGEHDDGKSDDQKKSSQIGHESNTSSSEEQAGESENNCSEEHLDKTGSNTDGNDNNCSEEHLDKTESNTDGNDSQDTGHAKDNYGAS